MGRKRGAKPKFGVEMTERIYLRMTPEQKARLQLAADVSTAEGGTADFWRELMSGVADAVLALDAGELTPETFRTTIAERVTEIVKPEEMKKTEDT